MDTPSCPPDEEPSSSVLKWVVIGLLVFVVGLLIGAGIAAWWTACLNLDASI
jgi:hypothetical protein